MPSGARWRRAHPATSTEVHSVCRQTACPAPQGGGPLCSGPWTNRHHACDVSHFPGRQRRSRYPPGQGRRKVSGRDGAPDQILGGFCCRAMIFNDVEWSTGGDSREAPVRCGARRPANRKLIRPAPYKCSSSRSEVGTASLELAAGVPVVPAVRPLYGTRSKRPINTRTRTLCTNCR